MINSRDDSCEIIKFEKSNGNCLKTSKINITDIPSDSKINIGLSKMIEESYGHLEISDKGIKLVKKYKIK